MRESVSEREGEAPSASEFGLFVRRSFCISSMAFSSSALQKRDIGEKSFA